ncbi:MAG TPA: alcohol dehydrogenase catalytic domain-containing protein [Rhodopila sp.]
MRSNAAVFRKVHEPLTIEAVDIDKPQGREVLVRTVATGVCHSDLHVVDGLSRYPTCPSCWAMKEPAWWRRLAATSPLCG